MFVVFFGSLPSCSNGVAHIHLGRRDNSMYQLAPPSFLNTVDGKRCCMYHSKANHHLYRTMRTNCLLSSTFVAVISSSSSSWSLWQVSDAINESMKWKNELVLVSSSIANRSSAVSYRFKRRSTKAKDSNKSELYNKHPKI